MGVILRAHCASCGLDEELYVGGGLRDCRPETALAVGGNNPDLAEALRENARFRIERRVSVCPLCRKPVAAARVVYQRPGLTEHIVTPRCPGCASRLLWPPKDPESIECPVCGNEIPLLTGGHWD